VAGVERRRDRSQDRERARQGQGTVHPQHPPQRARVLALEGDPGALRSVPGGDHRDHPVAVESLAQLDRPRESLVRRGALGQEPENLQRHRGPVVDLLGGIQRRDAGLAVQAPLVGEASVDRGSEPVAPTLLAAQHRSNHVTCDGPAPHQRNCDGNSIAGPARFFLAEAQCPVLRETPQMRPTGTVRSHTEVG
jgi:hypothetical protein